MFLKGLFGLAWLVGKALNEPNDYHKNPYNTTEDYVARLRKPTFDVELWNRINGGSSTTSNEEPPKEESIPQPNINTEEPLEVQLEKCKDEREYRRLLYLHKKD